MSVTAAQLLALALGLGSAVCWGALATSNAPLRRPAWWGIAAGAVVATVGSLAALAVLWAHDWWFAADRVMTSAPLSVAALVWFCVSAARDFTAGERASTSTKVAAWGGAFAAAAGVFVPFVLGAPLSPWIAAAVVLVVAGATAIAWLALSPRRARRPLTTAIAAVAAVVLAATGLSLSASAAPGTLASAHAHGGDGAQNPGTGDSDTVTSVIALRGDSAQPPDVSIDLEAQQSSLTLPSGRDIEAWTYGELGGPPIEASVGDLIQVTLHNRDIDDGVTVHWHGYPVPNGEDGVAGVTQDAVAPGETYTYRFEATEPGTYWYHTHQRSSEGVVKGLYGTLVVHPADEEPAGFDMVVPLHSFAGHLVMGDTDEELLRTVEPGTDVRLRLINTDQLSRELTVTGTPFEVLAIDGTDAAHPTEIEGQSIRIPAGSRYDLGFTMPDAGSRPESGVRVADTGSRSASIVLVAHEGDEAPAAVAASGVFDLLSYDAGPMPDWASEPFDVQRTMVLDKLPRLTENGPAYAYTIDGQVYPHIAPTEVAEGDTVELTFVNRGTEVHPMHPHGHRVLVLEVDGRTPAGPVWLDSFDVAPGQVWRVALVADNPGIWMDHCHNLEHAALGMVTHLAYAGVVTPFQHGGPADNDAE